MKKTLTVNLGGTVFHIDEDAYRLLDNYLCNLKLHFGKEEGADEIVGDMEARISELFAEKLASGLQVITIADVEEVITRMGKPEELGDDPQNETSGERTGSGTGNGAGYARYTESEYTGRTTGRQLYRNPDNKVLGGVASGLAAYFGWDSTLVRLLLLLMLVIPYFPVVWLYIVLWIIIPEARTAAQKLHMRGEHVTVESIGKTVTDGFERVSSDVKDFVQSDKSRTFLQKLGDVLVQIAGFLLKAFLVVLAIVCSPVLFVLAIVFVVLIIAAIAMMVGGGAALFSLLPAVDWLPLVEASPALTLGGSISGIVVVGVPLLGLVYAILRQVFNWVPMSGGLKWSLFALWLIALMVCIFAMATLGWSHPFLLLTA